MTSRRRRIVAAAAGLAIGLLGVGVVLALRDDGPDVDGEFVLDQPGVYSEPVTTNDRSGDELPDVELTDVNGDTVALRSFTGKPMVVNIWYATCPPCARELRDFATVSAELGDAVQFVGVDPIDDADDMLAFADARDVQYPLLLDDEGRLVSAADVTAFP